MTARISLARRIDGAARRRGRSAFAQDDDAAAAEQVFPYTARADAERVYLDFAVLDGYYLYRSRFGFGSGTDGVALGAAGFPRGEMHSDQFFGEQEIYRRKFEVAIPYRRTGNATSSTCSSSCKAARTAASAICRRIGPPRSRSRRRRSRCRAPSTRPRPATCSRRRRVHDERALRQAERAHGRLANRPRLLLLSRQADLCGGRPHRASARRVTRGRAAYDDNFGDVHVFHDYVEAKCRSRAQAPTRSTSS